MKERLVVVATVVAIVVAALAAAALGTWLDAMYTRWLLGCVCE
jgi:hypothetical protein